MIKRLRIWLKELNLSQQLLTLIFFSVTMVTVFFFGYLTNNITVFVDQEMFRMISRTQQRLIDTYQSNHDIKGIANYSDSIVTHFFVDVENEDVEVIGASFYANDIVKAVIDDAINNYPQMKNNILTLDKTRILYRVDKVEDEILCVSLLNETYRSDYKTSLVNSIINVVFFVVGILFVTLMAWVGSLIHPLNTIRNYLERTRNGEEAQLKIYRRDEIGDVAKAIVNMQNELKKEVAVKDEMIQNISHDLKTPIATIKSYAESIKDGIYPYDSLDKSVDVIIEHANRLEKKVYSLLMLNKMGYLQDTAPEGNTLDMSSVIQKVILSMEVVRKEVNITPFLKPIKFHGDEEPWRIVVENLLENAIRYAESEIVITLNEDELEISNDGPTMSSSRMEKLFRPYEKGNKGQFGLGLSIVYRVCSTYGYKVEAENVKNGVLFRVYRPKDKKMIKNKQASTKII